VDNFLRIYNSIITKVNVDKRKKKEKEKKKRKTL